MDIAIRKPGLPKTGVMAVFARGNTLTLPAKQVDEAAGHALTRAVQASTFSGKCGEMVEVAMPQGLDLDRLILVGLGEDEALRPRDYTELGGKICARVLTGGPKALTIALDDQVTAGVPAHEAAAELAMGARLRSYRFDKYRTKEPVEKKPTLKSVTVTTDAQAAAEVLFKDLDAVSSGVFLARDLTTEPANTLTPAAFAERIEELRSMGCTVEILDEAALREKGFGALLGVGQGSTAESKVAVIQWPGKSGDGPLADPIALVGKGVTFDSGGISIKPAQGMEQMKFDMGGAAIVVGAMQALAARKAKVDAVAVVGLVENMPSGSAIRPGDVLTSMSGQTIEVINTDAEGRLVLADCLHYVRERFNPAAMIDFATLTGAIIIGLGHDHAGLFSDDEALAMGLFEAGQATGDRVWRLPLDKAYDKQLDSQIADMKNVGGRPAGSITAAQFLKRFAGDTPWAHIDVAGTVWAEQDTDLGEKGATGFGVRLVDRYIADTFEH